MDDLASLNVVVHGRVQGVSFRYFVLKEATALGLTGWVRNLPDEDRVEVSAEGPRLKLEALVALLRVGPPGAGVTSLDVKWGEFAGNVKVFQIRR